MNKEQLQTIEEQHTELVLFFDIVHDELDSMVAWNSDTLAAEFWEMFDTARMITDDAPRLIAEVRSLRAKLDAVPVAEIRELMAAFEVEGFPFGYLQERHAVTTWLNSQAVQP